MVVEMRHRKTDQGLIIELSSQETAVATKLLSWMLQGSPPSLDAHVRVDLSETATWLYEAAKDRHQLFPQSIISDPAWEMLITLYYVESRRQTINISGLCAASGAPASTALRWLVVLEEFGFAVREDHPTDRRCTFVRLTPIGHKTMDAYLMRLRKRILSVG